VRAKQLLWSFSLFLLFAISGYAQRPLTPPRVDSSVVPLTEDENRERIERDMAKKANVERQAALKADTDKLLKLATELKASVDKSNENTLSIDVLKKAEEIEKLAHSVKDKMKGPN
jgi:16S rRNA A1518/A1519 N6-dimethyltransferase RsmA/KsgA/DIM1 with predicted DNA glycosylase/AP lyase activity